MAVVKIKAGNRSKSTAKPKEDEAPKPTRSRRGSTKAKPAAKRASTKKTETPARRGPGRPRKQEASAEKTEAPRRYRTSDIDARTEAKMIKLVEKAGERRRKAEIEHKESVNALHDAAREALGAGVSMAKVSDASGISRQWLYKMGDFADRGTQLRAGNGNGASEEKPKPTTRRTRGSAKPAAKPAAKKTGTARKNTKTTGTSKPRRKVSIRS